MIWPVARPTARSAMKLSSVSPERWLVITHHPASLAMRTASIDSGTVPIWLTCARRRSTRVTRRSRSGAPADDLMAVRTPDGDAKPLHRPLDIPPAAKLHFASRRDSGQEQAQQTTSRRVACWRGGLGAAEACRRAFSSSALQAFFSMAVCTRFGLVTSRSSPTTCAQHRLSTSVIARSRHRYESLFISCGYG